MLWPTYTAFGDLSRRRSGFAGNWFFQLGPIGITHKLHIAREFALRIGGGHNAGLLPSLFIPFNLFNRGENFPSWRTQ